MNRKVIIFLSCLAVMPIAVANGKGDAAVGKVLVDKWGCNLCHGPDGNGNKGILVGGELIPRISAQPQAYFVKRMQKFKDSKCYQDDNDMRVLVEQLPDDDIRNLAAWYGSQTPKAEPTYNYAQ